MARTDIPKNVRQLVLRHIDSVQQVEILELLARDPDHEWSSAQISRSLHIPPDACEQWLRSFAAAGMVERTVTGCGMPAAAATRARSTT